MAEENGNGNSKKKLIIFAIAAVLILAAGIVIGVIIGNSGKKDKTDTNQDNPGTVVTDNNAASPKDGDKTAPVSDISDKVTDVPDNGDSTTPVPDDGKTADTVTSGPEPTDTPTSGPKPTAEPTSTPTSGPTAKPTAEPTSGPTTEPTSGPTVEPTLEPTSGPTAEPTSTPTLEPTSTPSPTKAPAGGEYILTYTVDNSWQDGATNMFGVQFGITNGTDTAVKGWKLEMVIDGLSTVSGWNGTFKTSGNTMTVTDAGYNSDIYANGTIVIGCNLGTTSKSVTVSSAKLNG
ncbi:MAG: cellulose binding domain-containing protein, partial [Lachnospiraceae bacterium]|nr:cellulose binding domain-containing protein [Lachnospiraceae bacterium]